MFHYSSLYLFISHCFGWTKVSFYRRVFSRVGEKGLVGSGLLIPSESKPSPGNKFG